VVVELPEHPVEQLSLPFVTVTVARLEEQDEEIRLALAVGRVANGNRHELRKTELIKSSLKCEEQVHLGLACGSVHQRTVITFPKVGGTVHRASESRRSHRWVCR